MRKAIGKVVAAWLLCTPLTHTRWVCRHVLGQFLFHIGIDPNAWENLAQVRPEHVATWRYRFDADGHSQRVTALTTARERGSDIIDLQDFAGHADSRTTLTYSRSRDRLSKSPANHLKH